VHTVSAVYCCGTDVCWRLFSFDDGQALFAAASKPNIAEAVDDGRTAFLFACQRGHAGECAFIPLLHNELSFQ